MDIELLSHLFVTDLRRKSLFPKFMTFRNCAYEYVKQISDIISCWEMKLSTISKMTNIRDGQ